MRLITSTNPPHLNGAGLCHNMSPMETSLKAALTDFRLTHLEPKAAQIDRLSAIDIATPGSSWWGLVSEFLDLGLDVDDIYLSDDPLRGNMIKATAFEELGRGDAGFAIGMMVAFFPYVMCRLLKRDDLAERAQGRIGCWIATQPKRGSDVGDVSGTEIERGSQHAPGSLWCEIEGDDVIISGESSSWVSLGSVAHDALAYIPIKHNGEYRHDEDGTLISVAVFIPLDRAGVSRGAPLEKLGQRAVPQGSLRFDSVRLPKDHIIVQPEDYRGSLLSALSEGNQTMGAVFTGLAQRAYDHAEQYVHERRQGGSALIQHQLVRYRLFELFRQVQTMRATMRQSFTFNALAPEPHVLASIVSKVTVTEGAVGVVGEAIRMFGGNGLTPAFPMEKLLRDARASVTEDGDNHLLSLIAGTSLSDAFQASLPSNTQ